MEDRPNKNMQMLGWILAMILVAYPIAMGVLNYASSSDEDAQSQTVISNPDVKNAGDGALTEMADDMEPRAVGEPYNRADARDRVDRTLLSQEREKLAENPESYGWNEGDRQFFEEHGVSEAEARAMETVLREKGVE